MEQWVGQIVADRIEATGAARSLQDVGPPAVPALMRAERHAQGVTQQRLRDLLDAIVRQEAAGSRPVRLKLTNAPLAETVKALSRASGVPLAYDNAVRADRVSPTVTLDAPAAPFWEALDRVCRAGRLTWAITPDGRGLRLRPGSTPAPEHVSYWGAFRLHVNSLSINAGTNLAPEGARWSFCQMNLSLSSPPDTRVVSLGPPRLSLAEDETGLSLLSDGERAVAVAGWVGHTGFRTHTWRASLKRPGATSKRLRHVRGTLPVTLRAEGAPVLVAERVGTAAGRNFLGEEGLTVKVIRVTRTNSVCTVEVLLRNLPRPYDSADYRWELRGEKGQLFLDGYATLRPTAEGWAGNVRFSSSIPTPAPAKLTLYPTRRVRVEVPFEFRDLPLP
jgi:hypothetical protein